MISMVYNTLVNASGTIACIYGIIIIQSLHKMVNETKLIIQCKKNIPYSVPYKMGMI